MPVPSQGHYGFHSFHPTNSFLIKKILKGAQNLKGKKDARLPITKDILIKLMKALPFVIQNVDN
jgi:hypothetical protein